MLHTAQPRRVVALLACVVCFAGSAHAAELVFTDHGKREFSSDLELARMLASSKPAARYAEVPHGGYLTRLSADGRIAATYDGKKLHVLQLEPLELVAAIKTPKLRLLELSGDGKVLVTVAEAYHETIIRRIGPSGAPVVARTKEAAHVALSHDGRTIAVVRRSERPLGAELFHLDGASLRPQGHFGPDAHGVALSADGTRAVVGTRARHGKAAGKPTVWSIDGGRLEKIGTLAGFGVPRMSPNGQRVAIGSQLFHFGGAMMGMYMRSDELFGRIVALGDKAVVHHGAERELLFRSAPKAPDMRLSLASKPYSAAISADGRRVITADSRSRVRLWDVNARPAARYRVAGVDIDWSPPEAGSVAALVVEDWPTPEPVLEARWRMDGRDHALLEVRLSAATETPLRQAFVDLRADDDKLLPAEPLARRLHFGRVEQARPLTRALRVPVDKRALAGPVRVTMHLELAEASRRVVHFTRELAPNDKRSRDAYTQSMRAVERYKARDYRAAARLWRMAADQGDHSSMGYLAKAYARGQGVPRDFRSAIRWAERAAKGRYNTPDFYAPVFIARLLLEGGPGLRADPEAAARRLQGNGTTDAWFLRGEMYRDGQGFGRDLASARRHFQEAAERKHRGAMRELARLQFMGLGGPREEGRAREWLRRAAEGGDAQAKKLQQDMKQLDRLPKFADDRAFARARGRDRMTNVIIGAFAVDWRKGAKSHDIHVTEATWLDEEPVSVGQRARLRVQVHNRGKRAAWRVQLALIGGGTWPVHIGAVAAGGVATREVEVEVTRELLATQRWRVVGGAREYAFRQSLPQGRVGLEVAFELRGGELRARIGNPGTTVVRDLELELRAASGAAAVPVTRQGTSSQLKPGASHSLEARLGADVDSAMARVIVRSKRRGVVLDEQATVGQGEVVRRGAVGVEVAGLGAVPEAEELPRTGREVRLRLRSGAEVRGALVAESSKLYRVLTHGVTLAIPKAEVLR